MFVNHLLTEYVIFNKFAAAIAGTNLYREQGGDSCSPLVSFPKSLCSRYIFIPLSLHKNT